MEDLVSTLTTGLIISLIFIAISYFFWRKFDKPTPLMIEREEERRQLKEEHRMWRKVENQMKVEQEEAEERAAYERRKAEERARAVIPEKEIVTSAWSTLGLDAPPNQEVTSSERFATGQDANENHRALSLDPSELEQVDDTDLLSAPDMVQVRQDEGVQELPPQAPDWELIERMKKLGEVSEEEKENLPEAPDLPYLEDLDEEDEIENVEVDIETPPEITDDFEQQEHDTETLENVGNEDNIDVQIEESHEEKEPLIVRSEIEDAQSIEPVLTKDSCNFDIEHRTDSNEPDFWTDVSWG
ncbi:MAG: hypothetical protein O3A74_00190 [archaeon]|nr:hypothetical protein [archaeon]